MDVWTWVAASWLGIPLDVAKEVSASWDRGEQDLVTQCNEDPEGVEDAALDKSTAGD